MRCTTREANALLRFWWVWGEVDFFDMQHIVAVVSRTVFQRRISGDGVVVVGDGIKRHLVFASLERDRGSDAGRQAGGRGRKEMKPHGGGGDADADAKGELLAVDGYKENGMMGTPPRLESDGGDRRSASEGKIEPKRRDGVRIN